MPQQIFLGTTVQAVVIIVASLIGGRLSDRTGRRKIFILVASIVYGLAMFAIAIVSNFNGFLVGMAISGLGFGMYMAVDLALVADVLPDKENAAKDLGVFNIAGALPSSIAPAIAPVNLAIGNGSAAACSKDSPAGLGRRGRRRTRRTRRGQSRTPRQRVPGPEPRRLPPRPGPRRRRPQSSTSALSGRRHP